jgi:glutamyl-tRNA reductase
MKEDSVSGLRLVESRDSEQRWPKGAAHLCEDIAAAKGIVEDEVRRFAVRKRSERLAPLIRALRSGEAVRAAELSRFGSSSWHSPAEWEAVEALARGIVAKLHRDPIVRLKELSSLGIDVTKARVLAELFASTNAPSEAPDRDPPLRLGCGLGRVRRSHD